VTVRRNVPVVTLLLIVANVAAAFALLFNPELVLEFSFRADHPHLQTVFTSLFLHANTVHLLGNMIFLAAVGAAVELSTGSLRFAAVYFVSGVVGVFCHYLVLRHMSAPPPILGASGCIAGCAAYYCVRYKGLRVAVAPNLSVSVLGVTGIWIFLQLAGAVVRIGDVTGQISFWSHLGGVAAGLVLSVLFKAPDLGQLRLGHEVLEAMNSRGPAATVVAARKHLKEHPNDRVALRQLARACSQMDDHEEEADVIVQLFELESDSEQAALLGRLVQIGLANRFSRGKRTMLAEKFKEEQPNVSKALLVTVLQESDQDAYLPEAMLALVALQRNTEPDKADQLLKQLIESFPLHPCVDLARKRGWVL
jgi:membrane associated rhomboid family serine protease